MNNNNNMNMNDSAMKKPEEKMEGKKCMKCGGETKGYKCDMCGEEADKHDENHKCGGGHCVSKCVGCNQSETKCSCA